jgi:hypothetical protein
MVVEPELHVATWHKRPALHTQTLLLQVVPVGQASLQVMVPPQPLPKMPPQYWPPLEVLQAIGTQLASPLHTLFTHTFPVPQSLLHVSARPQPSPTVPQ